MKLKNFMIFCMMAFASMMLVTACGDDDKNDEGTGNPDDVNITVGGASMTETDNQLAVTYVITIANMKVTVKWICDFSNNRCVRSVEQTTYPSESAAKMSYEDSKAHVTADRPSTFSLNGKVVTEDNTWEHQGRTKEEIKSEMKFIVDAYGK